jgi:hypothetical protein
MSILAHRSERGIVGKTLILAHSFDTTCVLGASNGARRSDPRVGPDFGGKHE